MDEDWLELKGTLSLYAVWAITTLVDSAFLVLWIVVTWLVNRKVISPLRLTGIDEWALLCFQFLFSVSTLAPVAITIYRDITIKFVRTQRQIRHEIKRSRKDEPD